MQTTLAIRDSVAAFLGSCIQAGSPLRDWWHKDLETQVQVISTVGDTTDFGGYTKDGDTWWHIRWPKNGKSDPTWSDNKKQTFLFSKYADFIGSSGWNWVTKKSEYVCFDFDSKENHSGGLTERELNFLIEGGSKCPYIDVLSSSSGKGVHYYVRFDPESLPSASNRVEHKEIANYILNRLKRDVGENLVANLDVCGNIFWVWSRKQNEKSYQHLSEATELLRYEDFEEDWKERAERIRTPYTIKQKKTSYFGASALTKEHNKILDALSTSNYAFSYDASEKRVTTHTKALQDLAESLPDFVGAFSTASDGTDAKQNCFMYPVENGGFTVFRFGNVKEKFPWKLSSNKNYYCLFNCPMDPIETFLHFQMEHQPKQGNRKERFAADDYATLQQALKFLGCEFEIPEALQSIANQFFVELTPTTSDLLRVCFEAEKAHAELAKKYQFNLQGKNIFRSKPQHYGHARFSVYKDVKKDREQDNKDGQIIELEGLEHFARHTKQQAFYGVDASQDGQWWVGTELAQEGHTFCKVKSDSDIGKVLQSVYTGLTIEQSKIICGELMRTPWTITRIPFAPEYGREREWNMNAPRFAYKPAELDDCEEAKHPTWDKILAHCGQELDKVLPEQSWYDHWGLHTGKEYLTAWVSCMLFEPEKKLPYLFLHGSQGTGKSTLHESIRLLMHEGSKDGARPLTNTSSFNGELEGTVLVYIEEVDLSRNERGKNIAYERIKDWTVNPTLTIRHMYQAPYPSHNYLHFIQVANKISACPIDQDDTRVTVLHVPKFTGKLIPENEREILLREEAPHFMVTLKRAHRRLPSMDSRLRLPVVATESKAQVIDALSNELITFIRECCLEKATGYIPLAIFYSKYLECSAADVHEGSWPLTRVRTELLNNHYIVEGIGPSATVKGLKLK